MDIERIISPRVVEPPPGRWSNALRVGDMLFVSGTVSRASDGVTIQGRNEYEQAKIIFGKIRHLVEAAGGAMSDVVKVTIYVVNIKQNTEASRRRKSWSRSRPLHTSARENVRGNCRVTYGSVLIAKGRKAPRPGSTCN